MIPPFNEHGYLPAGVHRAMLDEIAVTFGSTSAEREEMMQSLRCLVEMCRRDDVLRLVVDGSFISNRDQPGDVDCVLLGGPTFGQHEISIHEWRTPLPFIHLEIADAIIFQVYVDEIFATDNQLRPEGVIEVPL